MPVVRTYACPSCQGQFTFFHLKREEPPPAFCSLCGASTGDDPQPLPALFSIKTKKSKSADQVYRAMEESSVVRSEAAAEMLGVDKSETAAMKITDLADHLRPGDIAAKLPSNPVTQAMEAMKGKAGFVPSGSVPITRGPGSGAGDATRASIVSNHSHVARQVTAAGNQGVYKRGARSS